MEEENIVRDVLLEMGCEEAKFFVNPDFESAFIGVSDDDRAVYDFDLMAKHMVSIGECEDLHEYEADSDLSEDLLI